MKKSQKKKNKKIKKERVKVLSKLPQHYSFWKFTLNKPKEVEEFAKRGNDKQKKAIKRVLNYMKKFDREEFDKIDGNKLLKLFK